MQTLFLHELIPEDVVKRMSKTALMSAVFFGNSNLYDSKII